MKLFKIFSVMSISLLGLKAAKMFLDKYKVGIYYMDKEEMQEDQDYLAESMDLRGNPTHKCICGSEVFYTKVVFDNYEIATYFLDMICSECGSLATAPTLLDKESME